MFYIFPQRRIVLEKIKIPIPVLEELVTAASNGGEVSKKTARFLFFRLGGRRLRNPEGFEVECFGKKFFHRRRSRRFPPAGTTPVLVPGKVRPPWERRLA